MWVCVEDVTQPTKGRVRKVTSSIWKNTACTMTHFSTRCCMTTNVRNGSSSYWLHLEWAAHITAHVSCVLWSILLLPGTSSLKPEKHFSLSSKVMFYSSLRSAAPSKVTVLWLNIDPSTYQMVEPHGETGVESEVWQRKTKQSTRDILLMLWEVAESWPRQCLHVNFHCPQATLWSE